MKTSKSKKLLAVLLSVLMLLSAIVVSPVSALADYDYSSYSGDELESRIEAGIMADYETRMKDSNYYTNLENSYEAWYNLFVGLIGHKSGLKTDAELRTLAAALVTQYSNMSQWTPYTGNATPSFSADSTGSNYSYTIGGHTYYNNLLYSPQVAADSGDSTTNRVGYIDYAANVAVSFYYPAQTVMLVDGISNPEMPVVVRPRKNTSNTRYMYKLSVTNTDWSTYGPWYGSNGTTHRDVNWTWDMTQSGTFLGNSGTVSTANRCELSRNWSGTNYFASFANSVYYSGSLGTDFTVSSPTLSTETALTWYKNSGNNPGDEATGTIDNGKVTLINYEILLEAMKSANIDVTAYSYTTLKSLFNAVDSARSFDPRSEFTSATADTVATAITNTVSSLSAQVSAIRTAYNALDTTGIDYSTYRTFANYIANYNAAYTGNNADNYYTEESYRGSSTTFYEVYGEALGIAQELVSNTVRATNATAINTKLQTAIDNLVTSVTYVDDTELQQYFDNYERVYATWDRFYTQASFEAFQDAITAALATAYNNNNRYSPKLEDTETNRAIMTQLVNACDDAWPLQRLDGVEEAYEATGLVTVDPVMYVHGTYNGYSDSEFAYMTNGGSLKYVADGTAAGEMQTNVSIPAGRTLSQVKLFADDANKTEITDATVTVTDGKLTGSFSSNKYTDLDYVNATDSLTRYITVEFVFSDGVYEQHRLAIKQNPVAQHGVAFARAWNGSTSPYIRVVNFEAVALGSYGSVEPYGITFSELNTSWTSSSARYPSVLGDSSDGNTYTNVTEHANYPAMYAPNDTYAANGDALITGLTNNQLGVDKNVGAYASMNTGTSIGNDTTDVELTMPYATYFLDISDPTAAANQFGVEYDTTTKTASIDVLIASLYNTQVQTQPVEKVVNTLNVTSGNATYVNDSVLDTTNSMVASSGESGNATVTFSRVSRATTLSATYSIGYYYNQSLSGASSNGPVEAKAIINLPFRIVVTDKSNLRSIYDAAVAEGLDSRCYVASYWDAYVNALNAAEEYLGNYQETLTTAQENALGTAITNARAALNTDAAKNTDEQNHVFSSATAIVTLAPTCENQGYTTYTCDRCGYSYTDSYRNALTHSVAYLSNGDGTTHTTYCSNEDEVQSGALVHTAAYTEYTNTTDNCVDANSDKVCDLCGQSLRTPADWTAFDAAKATLLTELAKANANTKSYNAETLDSIASTIANDVPNFTSTETERKGIFEEDQATVVDPQTAKINEAIALLAADSVDSSTKAQVDESLSNLNADAYYVDTIRTAVATKAITRNVTIGGTEYKGYDYNAYLTEYQTQLNTNYIPYTVVIDANGSYQALKKDGTYEAAAAGTDDDGYITFTKQNGQALDTFRYGDSVTVSMDDGNNYAWSVYAYSNQSGRDTEQIFKYLTDAESVTVNVRGNMLFKNGEPGDEYTHRVEIRLMLDGVKTGTVLETRYIMDGDPVDFATDPIAVNIAFYNMAANPYSVEGVAIGEDDYIPDGDCIVYVNYTGSKAEYSGNIYDFDGNSLGTWSGAYNELVTLNYDGAVAFIDDDTISNTEPTVLCYGSTYSFYACDNTNITVIEYLDDVLSAEVASVWAISQPIVRDKNDGKQVYMVGSFALPQGCTAKAYGIILDANGTYGEGELNLSVVDREGDIYNLAAGRALNTSQRGNQFAINFYNNGTFYYNANYVAYVIYTDATGIEHYAYSPVVVDASIY